RRRLAGARLGRARRGMLEAAGARAVDPVGPGLGCGRVRDLRVGILLARAMAPLALAAEEAVAAPALAPRVAVAPPADRAGETTSKPSDGAYRRAHARPPPTRGRAAGRPGWAGAFVPGEAGRAPRPG